MTVARSMDWKTGEERKQCCQRSYSCKVYGKCRRLQNGSLLLGKRGWSAFSVPGSEPDTGNKQRPNQGWGTPEDLPKIGLWKGASHLVSPSCCWDPSRDGPHQSVSVKAPRPDRVTPLQWCPVTTSFLEQNPSAYQS